MPQARSSRLLGFGRRSKRKSKVKPSHASRRRRVRMEPLEDRRLLALLGVTLDSPTVFANSTGTVNYNATTDAFVATADPIDFFDPATLPFPVFFDSGTPKSWDLQAQVDGSGNLVGGVAGDDFVLTGAIDIDADGTVDVTGTLLTGEITGFGWQDNSPATNTDNFDARLSVTGGALAQPGTLSNFGNPIPRPDYYSGKDIALQLTSEVSTFLGNFQQDFGGGNKVFTGPTDAVVTSNPAIDIEKCVEHTVVGADEMFVIDFEGFAKGTVITNQYAGIGVNITADNARAGAPDQAMIFDSANPTGGDYDLGTPNQSFGGPGVGSGGAANTAGENAVALGNILIISEDGDATDPDDEAQGGTITFTFDEPVTINHLDLLDIDTNENGGTVVTVNTAAGSQTFNIAALGNNSYQRIEIMAEDVLSLDVNFPSSGAITELKFSKKNETVVCSDADVPSGPSFPFGSDITFNYVVTNTGDIPLQDVVVTDDNATPTNLVDDFNPTFVGGDTNNDGVLDLTETWTYTYTITAAMAGQFTNTADVEGTGENQTVGDQDPANYQVQGVPGISIEKLTNGVDADTPAEAVEIAAGATVTWTYLVENTGSTSFAAADVTVTDDNGTPGNLSDDFNPDPVLAIDGFNVGDLNDDNVLDPGEIWEYSASDIAQTIATSGVTSVLYFNGSSALSGTPGNVRSFSVDGVSVDVTAHSRTDGGVWDDAYLGIYSGGLGVTDTSEGDGGNGTHRVDNIGRDNYVLFQFSETVIVDQTFLDSVVGDSDLSVWIGSTTTPITQLSDAVLNGFYNETNNTGSSSARWANVNAGEVSGNVLVLAASVTDATPEDRFKIRKVKFQQVIPDVYSNIGAVSAGVAPDDVSADDPSHYKNPVPQNTGKIGNFVWNDVDRDGQQDADEVGIAGVTVKLRDAQGGLLATTTTDGNGMYVFNELPAGQYIVEFVKPEGFVFSPQYQGTNSDNGSNANPATGKTDVIHLDAAECDNTIDAGMYEAAVDFMFEAEDYEWKDWPWKVYNSSYASGGQFIKAPNGTGSHYNSPPSGKKVMYNFNVESAGNYEVSGLVKAASSKDNSVWIKVDNQPWVQWHMNVNSSFTWQTVTDGWHKKATSFQLDAGSHTMQLKVREDGTKLDKFMFSKLAVNTIVIDAVNDISTGSSKWQVEADDDGNEFLVAATGTHYSTPPAGSEVTYDFTVDQAGTYQMHALVNALNGGDNSFWVAIDDGPWVQWHLTVTDGQWQWQTVTSGSDQQAITFDLSAGNHTLRFKVREDGTKLDKIVITNDANLDLNTIP